MDERGVDIDTVARETGITPLFLEQLETGETTVLPRSAASRLSRYLQIDSSALESRGAQIVESDSPDYESLMLYAGLSHSR